MNRIVYPEFPHLVKYSLCWAFLAMESMWVSHSRSWEMVVPMNLNDSTCYSAVHDGEWGECRGVLPEVHNHLPCFERVQLQVVVTAPDSQLFFLSVSRLVSIVDEADDGSVICKFQDLDRGVFCSAFVYREKSSGESTHPWGAPVLIVIVLDVSLSSLTSCCLSVRKLVIHWQMEVGTESWVSLSERRSGMMVLKAELKSTNNILA